MNNDQHSDILVSVWMAAYYAGDHIAQGIESILMQQTDYPYEIVISDDCSGDNTWEVVSAYAQKYPHLICAVRNEQNLGLSANVLATKRRCKGKYIVNLSGDDYWIDPLKIQKQVDFLESHPEYVGVGSKVEMRYDNAQEAFSSYPAQQMLGKNFTVTAYNQGINLPSHGFMVRNIFADPEKWEIIESVYGVSDAVDDLYDPLLYLQFGRIFIMEEATCVYRVAAERKGRHNFNSSKKAVEKGMLIFNGYVNLEKLQLPDVNLYNRFCTSFNLLLLSAITQWDFKNIGRLYRQIPLRYRKPWYKSVGLRCAFSVWGSGFRYLKSRIKRKLAKQ